MRVAASSLVALLVLVASASASLVPGWHDHAHRATARKHAHAGFLKHGGANKMREGAPASNDEYGMVYQLVYNISLAAMTKNVNMASAAVADDALVITPLQCGIVDKTVFLAEEIANSAVAAKFVQLGAWVGIGGNSGFFRATSAIIAAEGTSVANQTMGSEDILIFAMLNEDNNKIAILEIVADRSYAQANATAMMNVWNQVIDAANLRVVDPIAPLFQELASLSVFYAWDQYPTLSWNNKSAILNGLTQAWSQYTVQRVDVEFAYAYCEFAVGSIIVSAITNDGQAMVDRFVLSIGMDTNFQIGEITETAFQVIIP